MPRDWFAELTGFPEASAAEIRRQLEVSGTSLRSRVNGRALGIGVLETPSVAELRAHAQPHLRNLAGALRVSQVVADVAALHRDPANAGALFQVASQFNLLEMTSPSVTPEHGVTRYADDYTQGPACAIAAGGATIYRNYFVPVGGGIGQTRDRQIDCLHDLGVALGNDNESLWEMRNGYALCSEEGLTTINQRIERLSKAGPASLGDLLRIGVHRDVEVTRPEARGQTVSQVFCSALPVAYTTIPPARWATLAQLVLDAAYEATMWAAVLNASRGSRLVYLTLLGGGAFGNDLAWIVAAIRRALHQVRAVALDVHIVSYNRQNEAVERLVREFSSK
jgi:hypothetical protein